MTTIAEIRPARPEDMGQMAVFAEVLAELRALEGQADFFKIEGETVTFFQTWTVDDHPKTWAMVPYDEQIGAGIAMKPAPDDVRRYRIRRLRDAERRRKLAAHEGRFADHRGAVAVALEK